MSTPEERLNERVQALTGELAHIKDQRTALDTREAEIKKQLGALLGHGTHQVAGTGGGTGTTVQVQRNARFDPEKFAANYPVTEYPTCYKSTAQAALVEAVLGKAVKEQFVKEYDPKVIIK